MSQRPVTFRRPLPKTLQKVTPKTDPQKVDFLAPNGLPLDPQWDPKVLKIRPQTPPKRRLGKRLEKITEKGPNVRPSTPLNLVRGLRNQGSEGFGKRLQKDIQRRPFAEALVAPKSPKTPSRRVTRGHPKTTTPKVGPRVQKRLQNPYLTGLFLRPCLWEGPWGLQAWILCYL